MSEDWTPRFSRGKRIGLGAAGLLVLGAAGGAGAVALTRPTVEMAPTVPTPIAKLADARGVVSVRGHVAEVYGDRFIVQDATGRTLVEVGRDAAGRMHPADAVLVQGHFDDGQLRARYLVDASGEVAEVGPPPPPPHGPGGPPPPPPGLQGPPPPPGGPGVPPLPPGGPGAPPPPTGVTPPAPIAAVAPSAPPPSPEDAAMLPPRSGCAGATVNALGEAALPPLLLLRSSALFM